MEDDLVWYAGYGSNLCRARFACYLSGGRPPGAARTYTGCRDQAPPIADAPLRLDLPLRFGGRSAVWGGGIAFLDPRRRDAQPRTYARAWLLTREQVADVVAQENHAATGTVVMAEGDPDGHALKGPGPYREVVRCGVLDGRPVLTVTAPGDALPPLAAPAPAYLRMVAQGLAESHGLSRASAAGYLAGRPGVAGIVAPADVVAAVAG